jgi:hypothetical protein
MRWLERITIVLVLAGCAQPEGAQYMSPERGPWKRVGPIVNYTPDNLYDYINGEADFVIPFGFVSLSQGTYSNGAKEEVIVDIYDMGSVSNAFALFRSHSSVDSPALEIGTEGISDEARVEFRQDRFYVDVSIPEPEQAKEVIALARDIAYDLPRTVERPEYLKLLPEKGLVARSEKYLPADYMGYKFLRRAVSAQYRLNGREVSAFVCRYDDAKQAGAALGKFRKVLGEKKPCSKLETVENGLVGEVPYVGRVAVFRRGAYLGGVTKYAGDKADAALLKELDRLIRSPR